MVMLLRPTSSGPTPTLTVTPVAVIGTVWTGFTLFVSDSGVNPAGMLPIIHADSPRTTTPTRTSLPTARFKRPAARAGRWSRRLRRAATVCRLIVPMYAIAATANAFASNIRP